jgi:hypothetical protein
MKFDVSQQIFEEYSSIIFHENSSSGSRIVPCGLADRRIHARTDMTKLIVAFRSFANAPKNETVNISMRQNR